MDVGAWIVGGNSLQRAREEYFAPQAFVDIFAQGAPDLVDGLSVGCFAARECCEIVFQLSRRGVRPVRRSGAKEWKINEKPHVGLKLKFTMWMTKSRLTF